MGVTDSNISPLQQQRERGRLIVSKKSDCFVRQLCKATDNLLWYKNAQLSSSCQVDLFKFAIMLKILLLIKIIIYDKFPESCSIMLTCF